jgi:phosphoribosylaminoimidazolecarboxamide formyltransferase / IMP cyclohydrolase
MMSDLIELRYGMNPHQKQARVFMQDGSALPLTVLNGAPGYINLLDALNSWQLVRDLKAALGLPAAASFKHVSPAGAAVGRPLSEELRRAYFVEDRDLSPLAAAYARARGADRVSSFGDWAACSDIVDLPTAELLRIEVSDGVIAPGYEPDALAVLQQKKKGAYRILQVDENYEPPAIEERQVFGLTMVQERNSYIPRVEDLTEIVTRNTDLTEAARIDMIVALLALKYTQSNSVCFTFDGQVIGMGAGQQSRIHCTRLAAEKADTWFLRQNPRVLDLPFREDIGRTARDNAIDEFLQERLPAPQEALWRENFTAVPERMTEAQKRFWLSEQSGVTLGSDAFFPFRDSIDRAVSSGARYIVQPGGSLRDADVTAACDEYGMVMVMNGTRLFHH